MIGSRLLPGRFHDFSTTVLVNATFVISHHVSVVYIWAYTYACGAIDLIMHTHVEGDKYVYMCA